MLYEYQRLADEPLIDFQDDAEEKGVIVPTQDKISIDLAPTSDDVVVPKECLRYRVRRDTKDYHYWQVEFPLILEGLVDAYEYNRVLTKVNQLVAKIHKKWCYSDGFMASMFITGSLVLLPLIPAIALSVRKTNKINKIIALQLQSTNGNSYAKSYEWALETIPGGVVGNIGIKFLPQANITPQQRFLLMQQSGINDPSHPISTAGSASF